MNTPSSPQYQEFGQRVSPQLQAKLDAQSKPATPVQAKRGPDQLPVGEYQGMIKTMNVSISTERPAIFTRCALIGPDGTAHDLTHVVRAVNVDSLRIGCDELRSAFPAAFADCKGPEDIIVQCMTNPDLIEGKPVTIGIEFQTNAQGEIQKDPQSHLPYYNVRMRPNTRGLSADIARKIAKQILGGVLAKAAAKSAAEGV